MERGWIVGRSYGADDEVGSRLSGFHPEAGGDMTEGVGFDLGGGYGAADREGAGPTVGGGVGDSDGAVEGAPALRCVPHGVGVESRAGRDGEGQVEGGDNVVVGTTATVVAAIDIETVGGGRGEVEPSGERVEAHQGPLPRGEPVLTIFYPEGAIGIGIVVSFEDNLSVIFATQVDGGWDVAGVDTEVVEVEVTI